MAIEVKKTDFERNVIEKSHNIPVLVDFWAEWCNPCRVLGPILEKLEKQYENRFLLIKINTETEKELAIRFKISSIPYVALFFNGKILDSFLGALNENLIRNFLEKNLPHPSTKEVELLVQKSEFEKAGEKIIAENMKGDIIDEYLWIIFKNIFRQVDDIGKTKKYLDHISTYGSRFSEMKNMFQVFFKNNINATDLKFMMNIFAPDQVEKSLDYFLKKIEDSSGAEKEKQKNYLFCCFLLLENDPLVMQYRKKLSRLLF